MDFLFQTIARQISEKFPIDHIIVLSVNLAKKRIIYHNQYPIHNSDALKIYSFEDIIDTPIESSLWDWQTALEDKNKIIKPSELRILYCRLFLQKYDSLLIPITFQNQLLGALILCPSPDKQVFFEGHFGFFQLITNLLATNLENQRKTQVIIDLRNQIETLQEVARILSSAFDQQHLLQLILDQLDRVIPYGSASIMLIKDQEISIAAYRKLSSEEQLQLPKNINEFSHLKNIIETRKPYIIPDIQKHTGWLKNSDEYKIRSWLGVPLLGDTQVIGILNLDSYEPYYFTEEDVSLSVTFANQASIAIENVNLHAADQRYLQQMKALGQTITDISSVLELPILLRAILERAITLIDGTGGDLSLYDSQQEQLEIVVSLNMGNDYQGTIQKKGEGAMGMAIKTLQPLIIPDYNAWEYASYQYQKGPWHSVIAAPFLFYDKVIGAIGVVNADPNHCFTDSDQEILSLFGQHAAIAVENARLFEKEKRAAERSAVLHKVSQQIVAASLNPEEIYHAIHQAVRSLMPADAFVINILEENGAILNPVYLFDQGKQFHMPPYTSNSGLSGRVIKKKESIYSPDLKNDPRAASYFHYGRPQHVRSILVVPMWRRGEVVGVLSTQSYLPNSYETDDIKLLEMLASYAAIALDNTEMFIHIQELAITDSLTGVYNRRHIFELGYREYLRARRFNRPLSLLMIDIDHFKKVNDTYGHLKGDQILLELAHLLKKDVREIDMVGRFGGEEFLIILPETNLHEGKKIAERIRRCVETNFYNQDNDILTITISLGIAEMQFSTQSFDAILENADIALYQAKNAGRNQVKVFKQTEEE